MNKNASRVTHFSSEFAHEPNYCLSDEITAEAHTAYSILHRLMYIFGILEHKWEIWKHIDAIRKYS